MHKHIGARYVYDEPANNLDSMQTETDVLTPSALAALPPELLANLHQATILGDLELMLTLIAQIRFSNEHLANALADLANQFKFEQLLTLIEPTISET